MDRRQSRRVMLGVAALIGAIPGFAIGALLEAAALRDAGMLRQLLDAGIIAPFVRAGLVCGALGALMALGIVFVVRHLRD